MKDWTSERVKTAYSLFFEALKNDNIQEIVEAAYLLFDHSPIVLADKYEKVLVQIPEKKIGDLAFDLMVDNAHIKGDTLWALQQDMVGDMPPLHKPVYLDSGYSETFPRITGGVYDHDKLYGHYGIILGQRPLQHKDLEIAELFVNALGILLRTNGINGESHEPDEVNSLKDLIDDSSPERLKRMRANQLKEKLAPPYEILVSPVGRNASTYNFVTAELLPMFQSLTDNNITILFEDNLVTLLGKRGQKNSQDNFLSKYIPLLEKYRLITGISKSFTDLEAISQYYLQSILTAKLAEKKRTEKVYYYYTDFMPKQIFYYLNEQNSTEAFVPAILMEIQLHDQKNNTEYYKTLSEYLMCFCNKEAAAKHLNIHRNTLLYRIDRIQSLFDISLQNRKQLLDLLVGTLLLEVSE